MKLHSVRLTVILALICGGLCGAETYEAPLDTRKDGDVKFLSPPKVEAAGNAFTIKFEVSAATDVEVAILDEKGAIVRHLAAGLLGKNAPAPFKKGDLAQSITWNGDDDAGKPVSAHCKARVSIGARPKLGGISGWNGNTLSGIASVAVGKDGEVFVMMSESYRGATEVCVLDKNGKYLRTIIPYPVTTPKERLTSVGQLEIENERLPVVLNAVSRTLYPLINGMRFQNMAFSPLGHLVLMSGVGTLSEHGPPRHLLALHPEGGAPEGVSFVGPLLRKAKGFMGGSGEGPAGVFDHLAVSPNGEFTYVSVNANSRLDGKHNGVFRLKWSDKEPTELFLGKDEPGSDDAHFNDPEGLAVDAKGNLYVCDWGNNRVMIFSPDAKLLGKFAVEKPQQIAVHPKSGEIYVLSCSFKPGWARLWDSDTVVHKFSAWNSDAPKELAKLESKGVNVMALDASGPQPKLWLAGAGLILAVDKGAQFETGPPVTNDTGMKCPWFVAGDPAHNCALVYERDTFASIPEIFRVDLTSGKKAPFCPGTNLTLDRDGTAYVMGGRDSTIYRYDTNGKPLAFSATGSNKILTKGYRGYGPNLGIPGIAVTPNGDIYVLRSSNYGKSDMYGSRLDVYGPDGKLKKENLIDGLGFGDCGVGVDAAGNVYVGSNIKPADKPFPAAFMGKVPAKGWCWWTGPERDFPWRYPHLNTYLFYWGSVFKFGPSGGVFYGQHPWNLTSKDYGAPKPSDSLANAPADSTSYRSAYLSYEVKVAGALWRYPGLGVIPSSGDGLQPDPGCICHNSRMAVDEYGRVFLPDVFRFSVEMIDTNGNQIARIGRYGNADSAGPGSKIPEPEIALAWPNFVSTADGKVIISDPLNRRIVTVHFDHAAEETVAVK